MRQTREISHLWRKRRKGRHRNGALKIKLCDKRKGLKLKRTYIQDDRRWFIVRAENLVEELEKEAKLFSTHLNFNWFIGVFGRPMLPKHIELTRWQTGMETALIKGKSRKPSAWEEGLKSNKRWQFCQSIKTRVRNFYVRTKINFTRVIKYRKSKIWTLRNFYVYMKPFIHFLYFIYARRNFTTVEIHPKFNFRLALGAGFFLQSIVAGE